MLLNVWVFTGQEGQAPPVVLMGRGIPHRIDAAVRGAPGGWRTCGLPMLGRWITRWGEPGRLRAHVRTRAGWTCGVELGDVGA
jgi:hypothetical protein